MAFAEQQAALLPCPRCGQLTDSLKQYRYMRWCVFLLAGAIHQEATERACPACMRGFIGKSLLINIVPANLLWLILLLPWGLILIGASCRRGHSKAVLQGMEWEAMQAQSSRHVYASGAVQQEMSTGDMSWARVSAVLAVLLCLLPVVGLIVALWALYLNRHEPGWQRVCSIIGLCLAGLVTVVIGGILIAGLVAENMHR
jgi:hypothetical protein